MEPFLESEAIFQLRKQKAKEVPILRKCRKMHMTKWTDIMALIFQSNVDPSADLSQIIQKSVYIHMLPINDHALINVVAENNRHVNVTPLKILCFWRVSPREFTRNIWRARRGSNLMKDKFIFLQKHPLTLLLQTLHSFICMLNTFK